jgi:hypothetical protein
MSKESYRDCLVRRTNASSQSSSLRLEQTESLSQVHGGRTPPIIKELDELTKLVTLSFQ